MKCQDCIFYVEVYPKDDKSPGWGRRHRYAPRPAETLDNVIEWPAVDGDQFCGEYQEDVSRPTPAAPDRGCRHAQSGYQVNPDDGTVWCFSCKPPRQVV